MNKNKGAYTLGSGIAGEDDASATPRRVQNRDDAEIKAARVGREFEEKGTLSGDNAARNSSMDRYKHRPEGMKSTMRDSPEYEAQRQNGEQTLKNEEHGLSGVRNFMKTDAESEQSMEASSEKSSMLGRAAEKVTHALGVS